MPKTTRISCLVCRNLYRQTEELRPRTHRYTSYAAHNFLKEETVQYAGVPREGSLSNSETQALYVRANGQYKRVGEICNVGHVQLNQEWIDLAGGSFPSEGHIVHGNTVICRHTGQKVNLENKEG